MKIEDLLKELGNSTGMNDLALNDSNVCRIVFDEKLTVDIEAIPGGETFFFHAVVCPVPPGGERELFAKLLSANLFGQETGDASFGLDKNLNDIVLFQKFSAEQTDYQAFVSALEAFVDNLERWMDKAGLEGTEKYGADTDESLARRMMRGGDGFIRG